MKRILLGSLLFLSACGTAPVDIQATIVAGVQLTDLAPTATFTQVPPTGVPTLTPTPVPTRTLAPTLTHTPRAEATRAPGAEDIAYGESRSVAPRAAPWTYAFEGSAGDEIRVTVIASYQTIVRGSANCSKIAANTSAQGELLTDLQQKVQSVSDSSALHARTYRLPYTGLYYLALTCEGMGCTAGCTQVDTSLELLP